MATSAIISNMALTVVVKIAGFIQFDKLHIESDYCEQNNLDRVIGFGREKILITLQKQTEIQKWPGRQTLHFQTANRIPRPALAPIRGKHDWHQMARQ